MCSLVSRLIRGQLLSARETVEGDTPAIAAICVIVGRFFMTVPHIVQSYAQNLNIADTSMYEMVSLLLNYTIMYVTLASAVVPIGSSSLQE